MESNVSELPEEMRKVIRTEVRKIREVVDYAKRLPFEDLEVDALEALCEQTETSVKYLSGYLDAIEVLAPSLREHPVFVESASVIEATLAFTEEMIHG